ncbi:FYN-binding protein, partial [Merops nubicus]
MAKCNATSSSTENVSGNSQPFKYPVQLIHAELQTRKGALESSANQQNPPSSSGPGTSHKPVHPEPSLEVKPPDDNQKVECLQPSYLKTVAQQFGVHLQPSDRKGYGNAGCTKPPAKASGSGKEEPKSLHPKPSGSKFLKPAPHERGKQLWQKNLNSNSAPEDSVAKPADSEVAKEEFVSAVQENEPEPSSSKSHLGQRSSLKCKVSRNKYTPNTKVLEKSLPSPRPNKHPFKATKEMDESSECAAGAAGSHFSSRVLKPTSHWSSSLQDAPQTGKDLREKGETDNLKGIFPKKTVQEESGSSPKLPAMNTVPAAGKPSGGSQEKEDRGSGVPRRKALLPLFKLGQPPEKPSRPPSVDLAKFRKAIQKDRPQDQLVKQRAPSSAALFRPVPPSQVAVQLPPPPRASHPPTQYLAAPSLPPRKANPSSGTISRDNEENYDDVEFLSQGHGNTEGGQESDGEMYEDINDIRSSKGKEKKQDKGERKRMDQEKKEQKEKEKKDQEIRKKFKLTGSIQVLHHARACADHKGGKNELTVKQGDEIEIIRLTNNPEGKWLGRIKGCYGYIKTTMVEIDYDSLRKKQPSVRAAVKHADSDQEVYDDVGEQSSISSQRADQSGAGRMFPPPPSDQEMYDMIDGGDAVSRSVSQDEDRSIWSWGILKRLKVKVVKKKSVREKTSKDNGAEDNGDLLMSLTTRQFEKDHGDDVYDDVDSSDFPPPPPELNAPKPASLEKHTSTAKETQKRKNIEKEEKEFRKKFKFDGEIKVLYSTTTVQDLPQRRRGSKDLDIKPGESLEIIESTDDTKVLCRNEDGK